MEKTRTGEGISREEGQGWGMTFNAHPRGVSRLFRVNDEIKLCSKSSNGGGMKSLSAPAAPSPSRNLKSSRVYSLHPCPSTKRRKKTRLPWSLLGLSSNQKKKAERGIPPRWKPRGIKGGGKKVVR